MKLLYVRSQKYLFLRSQEYIFKPKPWKTHSLLRYFHKLLHMIEAINIILAGIPNTTVIIWLHWSDFFIFEHILFTLLTRVIFEHILFTLLTRVIFEHILFTLLTRVIFEHILFTLLTRVIFEHILFTLLTRVIWDCDQLEQFSILK